MFQGWRFKLREVEEALEHGQLDEACRLLVQGDLRQYLPGKRLTTKVAGRLAERARRHAIHGDMPIGWKDLESATALAGKIGPVLSAREEIASLALGEAESHITTGDPARALSLLEDLERHEVKSDSLRMLKEAARRFESARHLASRGKFAEAEALIREAAALCPTLESTEPKRCEYHDKIEPFRQLTEALHRAMADKQWTEAARTADQALEMAPENRLARDVRRRAWAKVGARICDSRAAGATRPWNGTAGRLAARQPAPDAAGGVALSDPPAGSRFLLWVDGVGGYLVCLSEEVVIGQAGPLAHVDIPIQADLSRRHAKICRHGDGYVIQPYQESSINGQLIRGKTLLSDGDEIEFARTVKLRFRQPHALSASARLDFVSHHRTRPSADGILLMAESCVLGPKWQNHVVCRDWEGDVVLYRRDGDLYCRAMDSIEIDGKLVDGRGRLNLNAHVTGSDFSMSLEDLS